MYKRSFLNENYDRSKSVLENVELFAKNTDKTPSDTTLYRFTKEYGIVETVDKAKEEQRVIDNYDSTISTYDNWLNLKKQGIKIGRNRLYKMVNEGRIN